MSAGTRPTRRYVVVPPEATVLGSRVDAGIRVVTIDGLYGMGTVEIRVPDELAPLIAAAFAGRPAPLPAAILTPEQLDGTACVRCGLVDPPVCVPVAIVTGCGQVFACDPQCPAGGVR